MLKLVSSILFFGIVVFMWLVKNVFVVMKSKDEINFIGFFFLIFICYDSVN